MRVRPLAIINVIDRAASATRLACLLTTLAVVTACMPSALPPDTSEIDPQSESVDHDAVADEASTDDAQQAIAATVPDTDIFVFVINPATDAIATRFLANVTQRAGYDNQPAYVPGTNDFLFASILDGRQSDVYRFHSRDRSLSQVTSTSLSEYSPTPIDSGFSAVVVEGDGTQRLWRYDALGEADVPIREDVTGVGYHAWLPDDQLALFVVDQPLMHLDVVTVQSTERYVLTVNGGRSLHRRPDTGTLSFVQHLPGAPSRLMDWNGSELTFLVDMPVDVEDLTWLPDGRALTVVDGKLLSWSPGDESWQAHADLSTYLPGTVTRLAVNDTATRLAIVSSMPPLEK
ncbi:MAG: hypothetical protein AAF465_03940 [Pseudomonadota bacterium]